MPVAFMGLILAHNLAGSGAEPARQPGVRADSHVVLDLVIADWLKQSPNLNGSRPLRPGEAIVLDPKNLPRGYEPPMIGRQIFVSDQHAGARVRRANARLPGDGKVKISSHVLYLQSIEVRGNVAVVRIADNLHHNLGGSGSRYTLIRGGRGWEFMGLRTLWQN